ncbi:MAG: hypothetical protein JWO85_310 [Candidatus Eremiobacteraeota bacterium]|nr:hypothetical protein [Candidatus Eremiobacteraeota bacterium]
MRLFAVAVLAGVVASLAAAAPLRAQDETSMLLAKLAAADPGLQTYRADVAFDVGLKTFPYLRRTLHGNAYFKRPARMEVVFTDLPSYARGFSNLYVGLGTPSDWSKKFVIGSAQDRTDGHAVTYLVLTPRSADHRLREVDVYLDAASALPGRIVWRYRGGAIDLRQRFAQVEGHELIVEQDTDIRMPPVHAYAKSRISNYAINVDVQDSIFTKKPDPATP